MTAALYARVSTTDQTCENQLLELRKYCAARGWQIGREFVDHGVRARMGLGGGLGGVGHGDVGWRVRVARDIPASNLIVSDDGALGRGPVRHLRARFVRRGAQAAA